MLILESLKAVMYGILEGITEWLPISSTGHLILMQDWMPFSFTSDAAFLNEFSEMFQVVIQLGAILAVVILFWKRLWPFGSRKMPEEKREIRSLWRKILLACIPVAFCGLIGDKLLERVTGKDLDGWLYHSVVVAAMLIVYGIAFIAVEVFYRNRQTRTEYVSQISGSTAFFIGAFQALSLVPGTSRSGSTILGARMLGVSRTAGAEFSFFLAIPAMVGAGGIKIWGFVDYLGESGVTVPSIAWVVLAIGCAVSFSVSLLTIHFLMDFVKKHSFVPFGIYRIILGVAVLLFAAFQG